MLERRLCSMFTTWGRLLAYRFQRVPLADTDEKEAQMFHPKLMMFSSRLLCAFPSKLAAKNTISKKEFNCAAVTFSLLFILTKSFKKFGYLYVIANDCKMYINKIIT